MPLRVETADLAALAADTVLKSPSLVALRDAVATRATLPSTEDLEAATTIINQMESSVAVPSAEVRRRLREESRAAHRRTSAATATTSATTTDDTDNFLDMATDAIAAVILEHRQVRAEAVEAATATAPAARGTAHFTVLARLSSGTEEARQKLSQDVKTWNSTLLPTLCRKLPGVLYEGAQGQQAITLASVNVKIGTALAGMDGNRHKLWIDVNWSKTTCLVIYSAAGLCVHPFSLAVAKLPTIAHVAFVHGMNDVAILARASILAHCADPWAFAHRHPIFEAMERVHVFRRLNNLGSAAGGADAKRHSGFNHIKSWRISSTLQDVSSSSTSRTATVLTAAAGQAEASGSARKVGGGEEVIGGSSTASGSGTRRTAAELSSDGVESELVEQCVHCSISVRCRDINDLGQHYMSEHRAELHLRDFDAAVAKAMSDLKARRTPLFVRTQLERTMARSSRTTTAPNQRYRPVRKGANLE